MTAKNDGVIWGKEEGCAKFHKAGDTFLNGSTKRGGAKKKNRTAGLVRKRGGDGDPRAAFEAVICPLGANY